MTTEDRTQPDGRRRFHLVELVGTGAFGEVYLAEQDSGAGFRRKVAIKLLNDDVRTMREAGRRMRDEARILGRLAHRNIVAVLDLVRLEERWAIIMDYVPGADIEQLILTLERLGEPFPPAAALEIGGRTLAALDAATHTEDGTGGALGVIHRDIKPSNVRVTPDGEVKVLDFGVARFSLDTREAETRADGWIGTERYMAPERILCEGDTPAGDVYATAASVVEMILGRPLGRTPVLPERHEPFVDDTLAELRPLIEADAETVDATIEALRGGLATAPDMRPTARALCDELERLARNVRGESLVPFARRVVPRVEEVLGHQREPATGILQERSSSSELSRSRSNPTLAVADDEPDSGSTQWVAKPATSGRRGRTILVGVLGLLGGLFATGAVVALGVGLWLGFAPRDTSMVDRPPPEPMPTEPTPPPQPAVVEPAVVEPGTADADPDPVEPPPEPTPDPQPTPAPDPQPTAAPVPDGPRIEKAQVNLKDASAIVVDCGGVDAQGTASARITDFPAGPCEVRAVYLGQNLTTTTRIERARAVNCVVTGGDLECP